ncbi:cupredoxin domain-containing protein [Acidimicrobiia bacterium EGI L10123]|uniref:cupredoxin domain-containing protein n=1 Tax=Salinilacustrithrix flava TaxID=2957203 RepID=UPI003D7C2730|nr:cupredoxin domain-containing protein [Acidimicrobiia bacterium EGI L10123]
MTLSRPILLLVLAPVLLAACGDDDTEVADAEPGPTITMEQSRYAPDSVEVAPGSEVTFENLDPFAHTVTSAEGSPLAFDSGELGQDETYVQTFDEAGTYEYFCEIHPTMRAEVAVG